MKSGDLLDIVIKNIYGVDGAINKPFINSSLISPWEMTIDAIRSLSKKNYIFFPCMFVSLGRAPLFFFGRMCGVVNSLQNFGSRQFMR